MGKPMFILNGEGEQIGVEYKSGLFPQIPNYNKRDSWFLLTEGVMDDIVVNEHTTVKIIRRGQYKRLVEISRSTLAFSHTFNSNCRETSYTFKVTVRANVYVNDPGKFCSNVRNISVRDFLNNQFSLDVKAVTRNYSILNYNGIDEDLTRVLTASIVSDDTSGLSYQITTVMTEPNDEAMKILKSRDDMAIKNEMTAVAGKIAAFNKTKTYADAIWEEAAKGNISDVKAIQQIEEYERKNSDEKMDMLLKLRNEGIISDMDISIQSRELLPFSHIETTHIKQIEQNSAKSVDRLFEEEN